MQQIIDVNYQADLVGWTRSRWAARWRRDGTSQRGVVDLGVRFGDVSI
jgi:hypothetical protein